MSTSTQGSFLSVKTIQSYFSGSWHKKSPASEIDIAALQKVIPIRLPGEYLKFLRWSNGGEGEFSETYLTMWSTDVIPDWNKDYRIDIKFPTMLVIADDSSQFYGYDCSNGEAEAVAFPMTSSAYSDIVYRFKDLPSLFDKLIEEYQ
ncbi:hypothetical protein DB346_10455 [Verrucomicrobia bacterium LW23]|nr:hypothetical protein DB346_10455 [Verrucomicrobia bacterium LW23]